MNTQLRDIEYFSKVAELGNVGRAAEALGLSQPALSKSLRRLEKSMQARLVRRSGKGIELTMVGSALHSHVERLRLSLDDVMRHVSDLSLGRSGHLRVSTGPGFGLNVLSSTCSTLLEGAPSVTMKVLVLERAASIAGLRAGQIDLSVTTIQPYRHEELAEEYLYSERFAVFVSAAHPLARKKRLSLADLAQVRWAVSATEAAAPSHLRQVLQEHGLPPPRITVESTSMSFRNELLAASDLVGFTSRRVVKRSAATYGVVALNVKELNYSRGIGLFYRKTAYLSPAALRFIDILRAKARKLTADDS